MRNLKEQWDITVVNTINEVMTVKTDSLVLQHNAPNTNIWQ